LNPLSPTTWQAVEKLGPIVVIAVAAVAALGWVVFFLLRNLLKQNEQTTKERQSITSQYFTSIKETVTALNKSTEVMERLCKNTESMGTSLELTNKQHDSFFDLILSLRK